MGKIYSKPAVREAIFEIKFSDDSYDEATPGQFFEKIKNDFPKKKKTEIIRFSVGGSVSTPEPQVPIMQAWRKDESALVQVGRGIVVANFIKYQNWEAFKPIIKKALESYIPLTQPTGIKRLGTRYINVFELPKGSFDLMSYFNFGIKLPTTMENLEGFNFLFQHKTDIFKVKTKFLTAPEGGNKFILDIDCFCDSETTINVESIIKRGTRAHDTLKKIFESFITDKMRNILEEKCQS